MNSHIFTNKNGNTLMCDDFLLTMETGYLGGKVVKVIKVKVIIGH